jgi:hypothetical protein
MKNAQPLYCVYFSGTHFAFCPTLELASEVAANKYCPHTGLSALIDIFLPGDLQLVGNVWYNENTQVVHQDDVPWLA